MTAIEISYELEHACKLTGKGNGKRDFYGYGQEMTYSYEITKEEVLDLQNNDTDTHTVSNQQQYGVDINNSSTYLRNNISYSMIANNKLGSDSDDDYASQILKNPYI